jgi:hypothetical protein
MGGSPAPSPPRCPSTLVKRKGCHEWGVSSYGKKWHEPNVSSSKGPYYIYYVSMPFYAYVSICAYYIAGLVHAYGISMNIPSDRLTKMHPVDKWDAHPSSLRSFHNFNTMQNWRCVHNTSMS